MADQTRGAIVWDKAGGCYVCYCAKCDAEIHGASTPRGRKLRDFHAKLDGRGWRYDARRDGYLCPKCQEKIEPAEPVPLPPTGTPVEQIKAWRLGTA